MNFGVLGAKRIIVLLMLVAVNALLAATVYVYLTPQIEKKERELRKIRRDVNSVQDDISRMQIEFDQFKEQQVRFEEYKADGFFQQQNRREVEDILKTIQKKSGVSRAAASVKPASVEDNAEAAKAEYKVLKSTISVNLEAFDDKDIFHYIYLMDKYFPGHITISMIEYKRDGDIDRTILRAIASGKNVPLVKAKMTLDWRTMIPESQLIAEDGR